MRVPAEHQCRTVRKQVVRQLLLLLGRLGVVLVSPVYIHGDRIRTGLPRLVQIRLDEVVIHRTAVGHVVGRVDADAVRVLAVHRQAVCAEGVRQHGQFDAAHVDDLHRVALLLCAVSADVLQTGGVQHIQCADQTAVPGIHAVVARRGEQVKPDRFQTGGQRIRCAELRVARIRRTVERGLQTGRCVIRSLVIPPCIREQVRKIIRFAVPRIRDKRHVRHNIARHAQGRCGVRLHLRLLPNGLLRLLQARCILRQIAPDQHARSRQQHHQHACQNFGPDMLHAHPFGALREASNDSARTRITSVTDRAASVYVQPPLPVWCCMITSKPCRFSSLSSANSTLP